MKVQNTDTHGQTQLMQICTHAHTCVRTHTHIHTHARTRTHTHTVADH